MIHKGKYVEGYINFFEGKEQHRYMRGHVHDISLDKEEGLVVEVKRDDEYNGYHYTTLQTDNLKYSVRSIERVADWDKHSQNTKP